MKIQTFQNMFTQQEHYVNQHNHWEPLNLSNVDKYEVFFETKTRNLFVSLL